MFTRGPLLNLTLLITQRDAHVATMPEIGASLKEQVVRKQFMPTHESAVGVDLTVP